MEFFTGKLMNKEELWAFLKQYNPHMVEEWNSLQEMADEEVEDKEEEDKELAKYDFLWTEANMEASLFDWWRKGDRVYVRTLRCCEDAYKYFVVGACITTEVFSSLTRASDIRPHEEDEERVQKLLFEQYGWKSDEIETFSMPSYYNAHYSVTCPNCDKVW
jgi:hypothetical protein